MAGCAPGDRVVSASSAPFFVAGLVSSLGGGSSCPGFKSSGIWAFEEPSGSVAMAIMSYINSRSDGDQGWLHNARDSTSFSSYRLQMASVVDRSQRTVRMNLCDAFFVVQGSSIVQPRFSLASLSSSLIPEIGRSPPSVGSLNRLGPEDGSAGVEGFLGLNIN